MKAVYYDKLNDLSAVHFGRIQKQHSPLNQGEVRLSLKAGSLNHLDLWVQKGLPHLQYEFPHIMGADVCAEVVESKSDCFKTGQLVVVYPAEFEPSQAYGRKETLGKSFGVRGENCEGLFKEELVVNERYLSLKPEHLSTSEAAALPLAFLTAWQMIVDKAQLKPGSFDPSQLSPILVHAAGSGVTQALLELLLSFGVKEVVTSSRSASKLEEWANRSVKTVVSSDQMEKELKSLSKTRRYGFIFDHVGEVYFEMNIRLLENGGKLILCGATSGFQGNVDLRHIFFRQLQVLGSTMGELADFHQMMNWVRQNELRPKIARTFQFAEIQEALRFLSSGQQSGKIVCEI